MWSWTWRNPGCRLMRCSQPPTVHHFNGVFRDRWHFNAEVEPETYVCPEGKTESARGHK